MKWRGGRGGNEGGGNRGEGERETEGGGSRGDAEGVMKEWEMAERERD